MLHHIIRIPIWDCGCAKYLLKGWHHLLCYFHRFNFLLFLKPIFFKLLPSCVWFTLLLHRPPFNLLRQELAGTSIYLDILQKTTAGINSVREESTETTVAQSGNSFINNDATSSDKFQEQGSIKEDKFQQIAEEKLVTFCGQVLREASEFQSCTTESANMDVHQVLELRSPIIVKVGSAWFVKVSSFV